MMELRCTMQQNTLVFSLFLIFSGAAAFATLALYARQALPIAYIVLRHLHRPLWLEAD
jgi:hypothetical protein